MAEKHQKTTVANVAEVMAAIFNMVVTSGQTAVRWADNDSTHAIYSGSGWSSAAAVLAAPPSTFFVFGSYMVIESSAEMPSGRRWQVKISRGAANTNLYINFAPRGSWSYSTQAFDTATYPYTGNLDAFGNAMSGAPRVLISTSDRDTYGVDTTYSYLRLLLWDGSGTTIVRGFYVGGYIPFDQANNDNPAICLVRAPRSDAGATTLSWGYPTAGASCLNRMSPDYTGAALNLGAQGYACITNHPTATAARDPNGNWCNFPVYARSTDDLSYFGYFGKYTMFAGDTGRTICTSDGANEYISVNDLVMRWKPSA